MRIIEKKENQMSFATEAEDNLINAVRRYISEIPVLAIEEVEIIKNDSPLYDETIGHRLGLIPLKMEKSAGEKGVKLKLSAKDAGTVYSGQLKGNADVAYDKIPITSLNEEQELEIIATTGFGKGSEHSKFLPGFMFYRHSSEITMDKPLLDKIKKACPDAEIKEKGDKIIVFDNKDKEIRDVCEGISEKSGKKPEVRETGELIVTLESFGQMSPKDIFNKSVSQMKKDLAEVAKKVSK